jgi:hypothetical protein
MAANYMSDYELMTTKGTKEHDKCKATDKYKYTQMKETTNDTNDTKEHEEMYSHG